MLINAAHVLKRWLVSKKSQQTSAVEMDFNKYYLVHTGVCSEVLHKEQFISQVELEGQ